jgi:hypothetical protein
VSTSNALVLSTLEFDVLRELTALPPLHVVLDVESPGKTHTERAQLVAETRRAFEHRGLWRNGRVDAELLDLITLLAHPRNSVDVRIWADRPIRALAAAAGDSGVLAIIDYDEVWLSWIRGTAIADAAVSVAGETPAGPGRSVSVPHEILIDADAEAGGDALRLADALEDHGVCLNDARTLARMCAGMAVRGQFGVELAVPGHQALRAEQVVAFHDTAAGRYLHVLRRSPDGRVWSTLTPADNRLLANNVAELFTELAGTRIM